MTRVRLSRIFWIGAAAVLVAAALVALAAVVRGDFSENDGRILVTLAALLYTGGSALAGLALADRDGPLRALGWAVAIAAPVCLALVAWGIWSFVFDGEGDYDASRAAWSAVLVLLVGLVATTALLLARTRVAIALARAATALAAIAATLSVIGIWTEPEADAYVKAIAAFWILAALCYFLAPVFQRFSGTGDESPDRVLAMLDGIELVATRASSGIDARLERGERLELRRRP